MTSRMSQRTNMPAQVSSFIGRERELQEIARLVRLQRFITFTGSGGTGKTRLAMQAAAAELNQFADGVWPIFLGGIAVCIGYRYWRVSSPLEQQQTKWVAFGFVVFLVTSMLYWLPSLSPLGTTLYKPLAYLAYEVLLPIVPITFFIAVQRCRLYDIDVLIRSTLIYGSLTAILAAFYVMGVVVSQVVVGGVMHSNGQAQSPLVIVATTLASAALFQPVRRRIQAIIDQRFLPSQVRCGADLGRLQYHAQE